MREKLFIFSLIIFFSVQCKKEEVLEAGITQANYEHFGSRTFIPEDNPNTPAGVDLGRFLFYEKRLSKNQNISCASCHQQSKGFTDGKAVSTGHNGLKTDRSAMPLVNLMWVNQFFWDGRVSSLEEQALIPIQAHNEMNLTLEEAVTRLENIDIYPKKFKNAFGTKKITPERMAKALAQFQRTLISSNARYDKIIRNEVEATERETRAIELFMAHPIPEISLRGGNCGDCHGSHLITLNTFHDNGLDVIRSDLGLGAVSNNPHDNFKMRAPSLRNIEFTAPYMHDGRFQTLEEVLDHYNEHIQASPNLDPLVMEATNEIGGTSLMLTEEEKQDIIFFLKMLSDEDFITNPAFSNPFEE